MNRASLAAPFAAPHRSRRLLAVLAGLLVLLAPGLGRAAIAQFPGGPDGPGGLPGLELDRLSGSVNAGEPIGPGGTGTVTVTLQIQDTWHVQAGEGSGELTPGFVGTDVELELPEGWTAGEPVWPRAKQYTLGSGDAAISFNGYEKTIVVTVPVTAPADAADGPVPVTARIRYQACDDAICEAPTSTTARGTLTVSRAAAEAVAAARAAADADRFAGDVRLATDLRWYEGDALVAGREASLGVVLRVAPGWHIQAGEGTGVVPEGLIATSIDLTLPEGWEAGEVMWPEATEEGWYKGTVVAIVPVTVPEGAEPGPRELSVTVDYQACDEAGLCEFPADVSAEGSARVVSADRAAEAAASAEPLSADLAAAFAATFQAVSQGDGGTADAAAAPADDRGGLGLDVKRNKWWVSLVLVFAGLGWATAGTFRISRRPGVRVTVVVLSALVAWGSFAFVRGITAESEVEWVHYTHADFEAARDRGDTVFIKFTADWCANCQVNERIILGNETAVDELTRAGVTAMKVDFTQPDVEGDEKKEELGGGGIPLIAVYTPGNAQPVSLRGQLIDATPVINAVRGEAINAEVDDTRQVFDVFGRRFTVDKGATMLIMGLAFIAGFLMNFTPCVLPVIPIKILSLQAHAKHPAKCFSLGLVFSLGIVALYAGLGILMAGLVGGVERLDWGQHFENWWLNGIIAVIILAMGIGMMGVFEIRLPQFLSSFSPQSDSVQGSFFMGVFTAILSTPCTGPLLGATVAWTVTQTATIAFTTLVVMGAGMAFPYILLTAFPRLLQKMPRAGEGSELLKQCMGLFMLAVGVWFGGTALAALGA